MSCQDCGYEKDYGFVETEVSDQLASNPVVLVAQHGLLSDEVVKEKSRLFIVSQTGNWIAGTTSTQLIAWRVAMIGYRAGFRDAEAAYRAANSLLPDEVLSRPLWTLTA